ncbi:hypothetical protein ANO11243_097360 [Dothideomycetidae sp. 11243]|nr:hypothetical protein ANO11243_097360 [fungal sp. No.11243]
MPPLISCPSAVTLLSIAESATGRLCAEDCSCTIETSDDNPDPPVLVSFIGQERDLQISIINDMLATCQRPGPCLERDEPGIIHLCHTGLAKSDGRPLILAACDMSEAALLSPWPRSDIDPLAGPRWQPIEWALEHPARQSRHVYERLHIPLLAWQSDHLGVIVSDNDAGDGEKTCTSLFDHPKWMERALIQVLDIGAAARPRDQACLRATSSPKPSIILLVQSTAGQNYTLAHFESRLRPLLERRPSHPAVEDAILSVGCTLPTVRALIGHFFREFRIITRHPGGSSKDLALIVRDPLLLMPGLLTSKHDSGFIRNFCTALGEFTSPPTTTDACRRGRISNGAITVLCVIFDAAAQDKQGRALDRSVVDVLSSTLMSCAAFVSMRTPSPDGREARYRLNLETIIFALARLSRERLPCSFHSNQRQCTLTRPSHLGAHCDREGWIADGPFTPSEECSFLHSLRHVENFIQCHRDDFAPPGRSSIHANRPPNIHQDPLVTERTFIEAHVNRLQQLCASIGTAAMLICDEVCSFCLSGVAPRNRLCGHHMCGDCLEYFNRRGRADLAEACQLPHLTTLPLKGPSAPLSMPTMSVPRSLVLAGSDASQYNILIGLTALERSLGGRVIDYFDRIEATGDARVICLALFENLSLSVEETMTRELIAEDLMRRFGLCDDGNSQSASRIVLDCHEFHTRDGVRKVLVGNSKPDAGVTAKTDMPSPRLATRAEPQRWRFPRSNIISRQRPEPITITALTARGIHPSARVGMPMPSGTMTPPWTPVKSPLTNARPDCIHATNPLRRLTLGPVNAAADGFARMFASTIYRDECGRLLEEINLSYTFERSGSPASKPTNHRLDVCRLFTGQKWGSAVWRFIEAVVAACFYLEIPQACITRIPCDVQGHIRCRLLDDSPSLKGMGAFLSECTTTSFTPCLRLSSPDQLEHEIETVLLCRETSFSMHSRGVFKLAQPHVYIAAHHATIRLELLLFEGTPGTLVEMRKAPSQIFAPPLSASTSAANFPPTPPPTPPKPLGPCRPMAHAKLDNSSSPRRPPRSVASFNTAHPQGQSGFF